ncbi:MAG: hypothetical protein K6E45_05480 [Bacteroidaceae bacterium]|nr:hypothetical protein [Bacteroidaceae bacterium]
MQNIHVTDGTLRLGSRNNREAANWHIIRLKKLTYKGVDGNSLYYALFPLIRQARDQWELCTCQEHRDAIDYWVPQALNSTPSDDVGTLQDIYDGLQETITTSTSFEKTKKSRKANLANKLATWNNNWNVAGKLPTEAQWTILRPALIDAVLAKDLECNYTDMDNAASALNDALAQAKATAVTDILANESDTDRSKTTYRMDGRRLDNPTDRGIYIRDGRKIVVK